MKINVIFFTSGQLTQAVIDALENAKNIKLIGVYHHLASLPRTPRGAGADIFLVADFGQILPPEIINLPKYGTLCLHPSLLPQYRGASPVQQALIDGLSATGLTIFQVDEKVDHGPILAQIKEKIRPNDTAGSLYERLFKLGAEILPEVIQNYLFFQTHSSQLTTKHNSHNPQLTTYSPPIPQDEKQATYTKKLTKEDGRINWSWEPKKIERFIRAMSPWPGAWSFISPKKSSTEKSSFEVKSANTSKVKNGVKSLLILKILQAHLENGKLILDLVQLPAKNPISYQQFLSGHSNWQFI